MPALPILAELVRAVNGSSHISLRNIAAAVEQSGATFKTYGAEFPLSQPQIRPRFHRGTSEAIQVQLETSGWALEHLLEELRQTDAAYLIYDSLSSWGWYVGQILQLPTVSLFGTLVYTFPTVEKNRCRIAHGKWRVTYTNPAASALARTFEPNLWRACAEQSIYAHAKSRGLEFGFHLARISGECRPARTRRGFSLWVRR